MRSADTLAIVAQLGSLHVVLLPPRWSSPESWRLFINAVELHKRDASLLRIDSFGWLPQKNMRAGFADVFAHYCRRAACLGWTPE
jgi:hypothetical protein